MKYRVAASTIALSALLSGCALNQGLNSDMITQRTSFALGLTSDQFAISNRIDDGVRTDYNVETKSGKKYMCFVVSVPSMTGRVVMEATCNQLNN